MKKDKFQKLSDQLIELVKKFNTLANKENHYERVDLQWGFSELMEILENPDNYDYSEEDMEDFKNMTHDEYMNNHSSVGWFPSTC